MILIIINCFLYIYNKNGEISSFIESIFMIIYVFEMLLKMISYGLIKERNSYFLVGWNLIDFTIIILYYIKFYMSVENFPNFGVFRVIRIVKYYPVRDFQIMVKALWDSFAYVGESLIVFHIFAFIFTLIGFQAFGDLLKQQCINRETGISIYEINNKINLCGSQICKENYFCGKILENPDSNLTNFDSFIFSFIQVLRIITFDNWTILMNQIQSTYTYLCFIYFIIVAIIGNYFLNNFILAVIKVKFTESWNKLKIRESKNEDIFNKIGRKYNYKMIRKNGGIWSKNLAKPIAYVEQNGIVSPTSAKKYSKTISMIKKKNKNDNFHRKSTNNINRLRSANKQLSIIRPNFIVKQIQIPQRMFFKNNFCKFIKIFFLNHYN